jgi:hypothetical protein
MSEGPAPAADTPAAPAAEPVVAAAAPGPEAAAAEPTPSQPDVAAAPAPEPEARAAAPEPAAEAASEGQEPAAEEPAAEAAPDGEKLAEAAADAEPPKAEPPKYEPFKLPEGFSADEAQLSAYGNIMGKYGLTQDAAQEIMDFGGSVLKQGAEKMRQDQFDAFAEMRREWVKDFDKQAGNRRNTILNDAKTAIRDLVPDEKQRTELWSVLAQTGAGDHPAVIRTFAALGKRMREGKAPGPSVPVNPSNNLSPADRRYGRTN